MEIVQNEKNLYIKIDGGQTFRGTLDQFKDCFLIMQQKVLSNFGASKMEWM